MSELKKINLQEKEFKGKSGQIYRIQTGEISVGRFQIYERKAVDLAFGTDFKGIFGSFSELYTIATTGEQALAQLHKVAILCHNQMNKIKESSEHNDTLIFCTLFCNTDDEDLAKWDMTLAKKKIQDWEEYDINSFFLLSIIGIEGYANALSQLKDLPLIEKQRIPQ